jgi:hypothetical protein
MEVMKDDQLGYEGKSKRIDLTLSRGAFMSMEVSIRRQKGETQLPWRILVCWGGNSDGQIFESRLSRWEVGLWLGELASSFGE